MPNTSYDSTELSSVLENDSSGRKLAQYLMKKDGAPRARRLFDAKERRISVRVELLKPNQEHSKSAVTNNDENCNSENITTHDEPISNLPQENDAIPIPMPQENVQNNNNANLASPVSISNLARSPNQAVVRTPELFSRPLLPQTPKSSQIRARVSSSDRLRRLSFKHLIGAGSKRVLLNELNATENSSAFSEFEPQLQNKQGCTSTPTIERRQENLANIVANLNETQREYNVQKGTIPGQIILTPSAGAAQQRACSATINKNIINCQESIRAKTPANTDITYGPHTRSKRLTNHNVISMILTDDEENNEESQNDLENVQSPNVSKVNAARNATFVHPRSPIHKKQLETQPAGQSSVFPPQTHTGELADDENTLSQPSAALPLLINPRRETELFDDAIPLEQVTFRSQESAETTLKSHKQQRPKKRSTPDYIRVYKNVRKKFTTLKKKNYMSGSKRSLYSMKDDTNVNVSQTDDEVTSTNPVATSASAWQQTKYNRSAHSPSKGNGQKSVGSKATSKAAVAQTPQSTNEVLPESTERRSRSRSKLKTNQRLHLLSSSSSEQSLAREESSVEETEPPVRKKLSNTHTPVKQKAKLSKTQQTSVRLQSSSPASSRSPSLPRTMDPLTNQYIFETETETDTPATPPSHSRRLVSKKSTNHEKTSDGPLATTLNLSQNPSSSTSPSSSASSPTQQTSTSRQNQPRATSPSAKKTATREPSPTSKKRKRSPTKKLKSAASSKRKRVTESSVAEGVRRSQRPPKPIKLIPYAVEIYTRCYYPERFKKMPKIQKARSTSVQNNVQNNQKRKSDTNHLQPRVKVRRLNLNGEPSQQINNVDVGGDGNAEEHIESALNGINAWLQSANVSSSNAHSDTTPHQYDGHFLSRALLICEQHNDLEFRYYDHPTRNSDLGYIIFKPKAVKKMVSLKHSDLKFICLYGEFKFKLQVKNDQEIKECYCRSGDAFAVNVGDKYGIENLSDTENGQIMMIKKSREET